MLKKIKKSIQKLARKKFPLWHFMLASLAVLVMAAGIWAFAYALQRNHTSPASLTAKVQQHMQLPQEVPTIATVANLQKLEGQPFFKDAAMGDKVLIYTQAKEVILYRPTTDSVIAVAPLTN